jgi:hypothetical protein
MPWVGPREEGLRDDPFDPFAAFRRRRPVGGRAMAIVLRWRRVGGHVRLSLFMGPSREQVALIGNLTMREQEAEVFRGLMYGPGEETQVYEEGWTA